MAVYGRESMQRLKGASVLISGINGLGAEIAKNVILANVKAVTLHDSAAASIADCGSHFYLSEATVGQNRAEACVQMMQELNPTVQVNAHSGAFPMSDLASYQVVVAIDLPLEAALQVDAFCRAASPPIAFIRADVRGLCGAVFVDLGPSFTCADPTGEAVKTAIVEHIAVAPAAKDGTARLRVQCVDDEDMNLDDGDSITFGEVEGMEGLNGTGPFRILDVSKGKKNFLLELPQAAAAGLGDYRRGGLITEVRQPKVLSYRSLADFLADPGELWECDESKMAPAATSFGTEFLEVMGTPQANIRFGRSGLLHLGFRSLDAFRKRKGTLPAPGSSQDAAELVSIAVELNGTVEVKAEELNEPSRKVILEQLAAGSSATLCPMAAVFGGIVGQEVVKACTGKFHPICQGFYFDALECLPEQPPPPSEVSPQAVAAAGRYAPQVAVFGSSFQKKLEHTNTFLVGSGALGCEFIKNFALMGVACAPSAKLSVTDDDVIEKSNLSRQFLFRNHDVGQSKSLAGVKAATRMNPALNAVALQDRVSPGTENVFNTAFWQSLDLVVNALDNVKARLYVDSRCVFFSKPLLESGTLGTKCNTQMVIPHMTENYGASRDPPEKEAPQCAVHNFPHNIDQCLVLAHSEFVGNFDTTPVDALEFLAKGGDWVTQMRHANESDSTILDKLRGDPRVSCGMSGGCTDVLQAERAADWEDCVGWARRKFESYFYNRVRQLLHNFPADATTSQGVPFWSPPKRLPKPLTFDPSDPLHIQFVMAAANLRAFMFGITPPSASRSPSALASLLAKSPKCKAASFTPTTDTSIETDNKEEDARRKAAKAAEEVPDATKIEQTVLQLLVTAKSLPAGFKVAVNEFEKDDDSNFHMDFISAFGNLRARNYGIEEIEKFQAKLKAGRIIPAIATTTAMATGFVCLELYKQLLGLPLPSRRNVFANLALPGPLIMLSEPMACAKIKSGQRWDPEMYMDVDEVAYPEGHTLWDKLVVPKASTLTLQGLIDHLLSTHKLALAELAFTKGEKSLAVFSTMLPDFNNAANLPRSLVELISSTTGRDVGGGLLLLENVIFTWEMPGGDDVTAAKVLLDFT
uniref:E1 ubiquitin-activating enzyme n=1 Tax=Haptolina ericina TaxID=156174 RepID=A0A7S3AS77_9EUKA